MKKWKKILWAIVAIGLVSAAVILYFATKKPATAEDSEPIAQFSTTAFIQQLSENNASVSAKFMDKNIAVSGSIKEVNPSQCSLVLDAGNDAIVTCTFDSAVFAKYASTFTQGKTTQIKGIYFGCDGFEKSDSDDMMDLLPQQKSAMMKTCAIHK
jgi:hypothetical protein